MFKELCLLILVYGSDCIQKVDCTLKKMLTDTSLVDQNFKQKIEEDYPAFEEQEQDDVSKVKDLLDTLRFGLGIDYEVPLVKMEECMLGRAFAECRDSEDELGDTRIIILLDPILFFQLSKKNQIRTLLHELRHGIQYANGYRRRSDFSSEVLHVVDSRKVTREQETIDNIINSFRLGDRDSYTSESEIIESCQSGRMQETDADYFSYAQFTCLDCLEELKEESLYCFGTNNEEYKNNDIRDAGYLLGSDIDQFILKIKKSHAPCKAHMHIKNNIQNSYDDYIPQHLLNKATQVQESQNFLNKRDRAIEKAVQQGWDR